MQPGDDDSLKEENPAAVGPAQIGYSTSEMAKVQRELRHLEKRYFQLNSTFERTNSKLDAYVTETKKLRGRNVHMEKELRAKTLLISKIKEEKNQLQNQAIVNRDYAKKLEQKLSLGMKGQLLAHKNQDLVKKMTELKDEVNGLRGQLEIKDSELHKAATNSSVLRRALDIRMKEMGLSGKLENGLLFEVARVKEQNQNMALQLSKHVEHLKSLEVSKSFGVERVLTDSL